MEISKIKIDTISAEKGLTRKALSERCGISRQNISTIVCRGTCTPTMAGKLAAGLGVPIEGLLETRANQRA